MYSPYIKQNQENLVVELIRKVKILIVDDEELICWSLKHSFEKVEGYHVNCAHTGSDALQELNENRYDIVITDLNLPDVNDLNIVTKIKKIASDTPVIVISASLCGPFLDDVIKQGAYKCFNKPFEIDTVLGEVKKAVRYNIAVQ